MTDAHALHFMGDPAIVETFRARIYGGEVGHRRHVPGHEQEPRPLLGEDPGEAARVDFIERLVTDGELDCPAYDGWVAALQACGWLPAAPDLEPNPAGPGKVGRWRLTDAGRTAWAAMKGGAP